jgi:molybdenum cofactor cytidylyltransferase
VLREPELQRLAAAGVASVVVAQLAGDDIDEDRAAAQIAVQLAGAGVDVGGAVTGRVNLFARHGGLLQLDAARVHAANAVHEGLTIATLQPDALLHAGQMLATIKIIPYAVPRAALEAVLVALGAGPGALAVAPWRGIGVGLVMTRAADTRSTVLAKMRQSVLLRLEPLGARLVAEDVVEHEEAALSAALLAMLAGSAPPDLLLISGIAATVDRADVVPAAVTRAGGRVLHAGMPVDPGNLLVLAQLPRQGLPCPVVGVPTCARSPRLNGFDYVLRRFAADRPVTGAEIAAMGVGGLLTEIESRPMPRDERRRKRTG